MLRYLLALMVCLLVAQHPSATQAHLIDPSFAKSPAGQRLVKLAEVWFYGIRSGKIDRTQLDHLSNSQITPEFLAKEKKALGNLGTPISFRLVGTEPIGEATSYTFLVSFKSAYVSEDIALNRLKRIVGLAFTIIVPTSDSE